jgi:DHA2 family multidrug resistance protein
MAEAGTTATYRWTVLTIVMMGTFMAILDSSIVNVSLPHMMSAFGVNRDQIEWVATGFMLASATAMPLVGWLPNRVGYKKLYLTCLTLFTLASGLCAMAWSLESLIVSRILQAIGAGAIQPIGMSIAAELFEPHERGKALGIWGMGSVVAPALGPTLGGYLTDTFTWRAIFSVNLPIGAATLLAGLIIMREHNPRASKKPFDFWGYAFLSMALIGGLTALSNGEEKGWDSDYIRVCEAMAVVGMVMFLGIESSVEHPIVDLKMFTVRNYALALVLTVVRSIGLYGSVFLLPIFLQRLMGYPAVQAGLWMIPNAISVAIAMPIVGRLADKYPPGPLCLIGLTITGSSLFLFGLLDPISDWKMIVLPQVVRGTGFAFMMSPLITAAVNSVRQDQISTASSFMSVFQNLGGAAGIALLNNFVTNSIQRHAVRLGEVFPSQSAAATRFMMHSNLITVHYSQGIFVSLQSLASQAGGNFIAQRAQGLGFENGFVLAGIIVICALPLTLLFKPLPHHLNNRGGRPAASD